MKTLSTILVVCILFFAAVPAYTVRAQEAGYMPELKTAYRPDTNDPVITYDFDFTDKDSDYKETPLRRFEIIFLILSYLNTWIFLLSRFSKLSNFIVFSEGVSTYKSISLFSVSSPFA